MALRCMALRCMALRCMAPEKKNPREFIGVRIIWCGIGDSPRGDCGRRATAASGGAIESSQTEESPETATGRRLPGTVPAVAKIGGEMRWGGGRQQGLVMALRCMAPVTKLEVHGTCNKTPAEPHPCREDCGTSTPLGGSHATERLGGSPRLCFAPKVRALARALVRRLQGRLPAGCGHAAGAWGWDCEWLLAGFGLRSRIRSLFL